MKILSNVTMAGNVSMAGNAKDQFTIGSELERDNANADELKVWANANFYNDVTLGSSSVDITTIVSQLTTSNGVNVSNGNITLSNGNLSVNGNGIFNSNLTVTGSITANNDIIANGILTANGNLNVSGNIGCVGCNNNTRKIFTEATNGTVIIGGAGTTVSGSYFSGSSLQLANLNSLPSSPIGSLAVSSSNLYYYGTSGWQNLLTSSYESSYLFLENQTSHTMSNLTQDLTVYFSFNPRYEVTSSQYWQFGIYRALSDKEFNVRLPSAQENLGKKITFVNATILTGSDPMTVGGTQFNGLYSVHNVIFHTQSNDNFGHKKQNSNIRNYYPLLSIDYIDAVGYNADVFYNWGGFITVQAISSSLYGYTWLPRERNLFHTSIPAET